ncbi:MAG: hypothetical protein ACXVGO_16415, partial [Mycobacterium sp.]
MTLRPGVVDVLKTLDERGILHSIAGRNDRELALQKLAEFRRREYFLHPHISWNPKSDAAPRPRGSRSSPGSGPLRRRSRCERRACRA